MKIIATILTVLLALNLTWGQADHQGTPIINSIVLSKDDLGDFELTSSYYTIDNNINNKETSVYVSNNPTKAEYMIFAKDFPSHFFIIHEGETVLAMIILLQKNEGPNTELFYKIVNPANGKSMEAHCQVWGEVSEKRANELLELQADSTAKIIDLSNNAKGLLFNGITYRIQPYDKLKEEVTELARQLLTPQEQIDDLEEYIRKETIDGKLDFNNFLEKEEKDSFLFDGVTYNKHDFALFLWGQAAKQLGITSSTEATKLWEEIHNRHLTDQEAKALTIGFESKIE